MSQFYVWDENNINIQNSSDFLNDNQRKNGFTSGTTASSSRTNTALRQSTLITAALMEMLTSYKDNSALTVRSSVNDVKQAILDGFKNFEATNMTVTFASGSNREALSSGETLSTSIGKISSWLIALKALAFKATVSTLDIVDGAVTTAKLANSSVATAKLATEAVTNTKLANNAVTTTKIDDNAITAAKLADSAVIATKIASNAITTTKITNSAITTAKFASDATCPRATYAGNNISAGTIDARLNSLSSRLDALGFKQGSITYGANTIGYVAQLGTIVYGCIWEGLVLNGEQSFTIDSRISPCPKSTSVGAIPCSPIASSAGNVVRVPCNINRNTITTNTGSFSYASKSNADFYFWYDTNTDHKYPTKTS